VHLAFDATGVLHVVFGITKLFSDGSQVYRFPFIGGVGHWKEGLAVWTGGDQLNCLNPDSLEVHGNLACSYLLDWNGNGVLDILGNFGEYNVGPISFPQIAFDQYGVGLLIMSGITESYDNTVQDYRHILYKYLYLGELGNLVFDFNYEPEHMFHECVYPSIGSHSPDHLGWPFCYQFDGSPGLAMAGDHDPFEENYINKGDLNYMMPPISISVNVQAEPSSGGSVSGGGYVANGSTVTIEAHAYPGWEFVNWTSQGVVFSTDSVYSFQAVWNYSLVAHFRLLDGTGDMELSGIHVSPNPARNSLNIYYPSNMLGIMSSVQLWNAIGNQVKALEQLSLDKQAIDISDLPAGLYLLRIMQAGRQFVERVIVE
jgi:hypothetical protein